VEIAGKVALVTGAGLGIGRAVATRLGREGAAVVAADVDPASGQEAVEAIDGAGGKALFVRADVGVGADVGAMVRIAEETYGGLDILINNAGGVEPPFFLDAHVQHWARVIEVNLKGVMLATHYGIEAMRRRGGGAIVNVASVAGLGHGPHNAPEYAAAKAGVVRFTAALATLLEDANIRVNCICPDWVDTPAMRRGLASMTPDERLSVPDTFVPATEIADLVVQLIRDDSLAGRVLVRWVDQPPRFLPTEDRE
jgi:NAD(P)-dependent dehydrogenase (short-subunit alcohol dehydrogenase family)